MSEVLQANVFFLIASLATIAFAMLVCIAMYYVIKILAAVRSIVERIEKGSDVIAEDVAAMRQFVAGGGLVSYLVSLVSPKRKSKKRTTKRVDEEYE